MKKTSKIYMRALAGVMALTSAVQPTFAGSRMPAATEANALMDQEILTASSSGKLTLSKARLIIDNDAAFEQKLKIIEAAKKNLYLTYFIYADDYSSSKFNLALIKKALSGTKVHLMVDLLTNYKNLDLFRYLEAASNNNIEVRFYNKPSPNIQKIAYYETIGCSHANQVSAEKGKCEAEKEKFMAAGKFTPEQQVMQKLWLGAFYSKNPTAAKVATVVGQKLDLAHAKKVMEQDKAKKADFKKLAKKAKEYNDTGSISAGMAAKNLMDVLGEDIGLTDNYLTGALAISKARGEYKADWDHVSDYTHQKMILADVGDGKYMFQLGGRNIEDSYHIKPAFMQQLKGDEKQKYLFKDTDFYGEVSAGGSGLVEAFVRNWDFKQMVATIGDMTDLAPYDLARGVSDCNEAGEAGFEQCVGQFFMSLQTNPGSLQEKAQARGMMVAKNTMERAGQFEARYVNPTQKAKSLISIHGESPTQPDATTHADQLSAQDLSTAMVTYIENLNTRKDTATPVRTFGAFTGQEMNTGKYISHLWQRGMENACALNKPTRVILHSAYLLPSSSMVATIGKMLDGTWNCHQVSLQIITNSDGTTDLAPINVIARGQMHAIFNKYLKGYNSRSASLTYYEYVKPSEGKAQSLHTKLSVLGDDMIVGSANADVRSYYMDSNNGVYIRNAKDLVNDYWRFIDTLVSNGTIVQKIMTYDYTAKTWNLPEYLPEAVKMSADIALDWLGRMKNPPTEEYKKLRVGQAQKLGGGLATYAFEAAEAILTPSSFQAEPADIRKACKEEPQANPDDYSNNQESYKACVKKVNAKEFLEVDPEFNLQMESF